MFQHLPVGVAHCRVVKRPPAAARIEILESNPAFAPVRDVLPALLDLVDRTTETTTHVLQTERSTFAVTVLPIDRAPRDEVILVSENRSELVQLGAQSRSSQLRFDQAFHGNPAAMVIARRDDLRILEVNQRWCEMFELTRDQAVGRTAVALGLIDPDVAARRIDQHRRFIGGHEAELELRTHTGGMRTVIAGARPIEFDGATVTLTTLIDITGRKRAEEAFAAAFNASPAGMVLEDQTTDTVIGVNDKLLEMTGLPRDALVGHHRTALPVLRPSLEELLAEYHHTGRLDGVELEIGHTDGSATWALTSTKSVTLHGEPHRLSTFTDITARKRLERRQLIHQAIGLSLAEPRAIDVATPEILEALCRGEGWQFGALWVRGAGAGALRCCGSWGDPTQPPLDLAIFGEETAATSTGIRGWVLATGTPQLLRLGSGGQTATTTAAAGMRQVVGVPILRGSAVLGVLAMARPDGAEDLDAGALGLFDSVGRLLGLFIERAQAEVSLRELNAELERRVIERTADLEARNRDLEAFSSSISHDLRAPLRSIIGFSQILLEDFTAELPREACDLLGRITRSGQRLHALVEGLLAFGQVGRIELRYHKIEVDALVRSVCEELVAVRGVADRLQLTLLPLGECHADPPLVRAVWVNLIDNAIKYSADRDPIVIEIGRDERPGETVFYVRDNGVGFDMAHAGNLFGVFQRLHPDSKFEGTGIGLANVRRIVERHHGRVSATSELGRGSRFEFTLRPPFAPAPAPA